MECRVKFFARARDLIDREELSLALPPGATVGDVRQMLAKAHPQLEQLLKHSAIALNNDFAPDDQPIEDQAELALLPPVSGG